MKKLFYLGVIGLILFEIANVYFIMPMPGSQRLNSIDAVYFFHMWRCVFCGLFGLLAIAGALSAFRAGRWVPFWAGLALFAAAATFDPMGRFTINTTNAINQISSAVYDPRWGTPLSQTGIAGVTTSFEYDPFGRLKKTNFYVNKPQP